ncbi:hypothetical protein [Bartonella taylorii]|uniref:Uncharacterized protein n=1 Tax=Bartonella taylorii TaxID=33046 RepID=A0A9Q9DN26_BARTA|nr:hypothetical protein [Bartonella taylorii]OPB35071.1 hypothetical protein Btaycd_008700 [Bartonella taylorii]USP03308.1 hypothetical protein LAJ60_02395 [Bartonella taylorii]
MLFLHLYCKKENFLPFATWLLLSSFGILLVNNLGTRTYWLKQPQASNVVKTNTLELHNKHAQLRVATTEKKKFGILHTDPVLPISAFQNISALKRFLMNAVIICKQLGNLQTHFFLNKRAPPLG